MRDTEWKPIEDNIPARCARHLVTVETDDGREVHTLYRNSEGQWEHEGECTFEHSYYFSPISWANIPLPDQQPRESGNAE